MSEAKHTPGPWTIEPKITRKGIGKGERLFALVAGDRPLATLYGDNAVWLEEGTDEANARLIAAAPDMLETLKVIAGGVTSDGAIIIAKAAIAKAEGQ